DGIEATRALVAAGAGARVLILTTFDHDEYVYEAFRAGASGFLLKDVPRAQLISAVRTVATGAELLSPTITRRLIEAFVGHASAQPAAPESLATLTQREREVLGHVARG